MIALLCTVAWAGELQGSLAADALRASSQSTEVGSGPDEVLSATELGLRLRSELFELDDRLDVGVDYHGREPIAGEFQTTARRVLYRLDAAFELVDDRLTLGAGRFVAPGAASPGGARSRPGLARRRCPSAGSRRPHRAAVRRPADIDDLGIEGLFTRAMLQIDDVFADDGAQDVGAVDRLLWRASAGYSRGGIDLEAGASFIDRASGPVTGRSVSPVDPGVPGSSTDLSPFVLQAQNIVFARAFASSRQWFIGGDLEANVEDVPEIRAFLQVGALMESRW